MQNAALKISSVLLCGLLIYNSLGYFLVLSTMRIAMRHQHWAQLSALPEEQLSTFVFEKNTINSRLKIVNKREILVDGKLYDVVRKTDDDKQIKYFCVHDKEEETLICKTRLFNSKTQQVPAQSTARLIINLIIKTGLISEDSALITESSVLTFSDYTQTIYSIPAILIQSPPPKKCC